MLESQMGTQLPGEFADILRRNDRQSPPPIFAQNGCDIKSRKTFPPDNWSGYANKDPLPFVPRPHSTSNSTSTSTSTFFALKLMQLKPESRPLYLCGGTIIKGGEEEPLLRAIKERPRVSPNADHLKWQNIVAKKANPEPDPVPEKILPSSPIIRGILKTPTPRQNNQDSCATRGYRTTRDKDSTSPSVRRKPPDINVDDSSTAPSSPDFSPMTPLSPYVVTPLTESLRKRREQMLGSRPHTARRSVQSLPRIGGWSATTKAALKESVLTVKWGDVKILCITPRFSPTVIIAMQNKKNFFMSMEQ